MKERKPVFGQELLLDCYECKKGACGELDPKRAVAFVKKYFNPRRIEKQYLKRGIHYYASTQR